MVKGISRRVIVVDSPDPQIFEQAIFILKEDAVKEGVTDEALLKEAERLSRPRPRKVVRQAIWGLAGAGARCQGLPRRRVRVPGWLWAAIGAAAIGLTWLLCTLF